MTRKLGLAQIGELARIVDPRPAVAHPPRSFELPTRLYGLTVAAYAAVIAVFAIGFGAREMWIPLGICVAYVTMAFGTPALWPALKPDNEARALRWDEFRRRGVMTATGPLSGGAAAVQVLILPVLILLFSVATVIIAALF